MITLPTSTLRRLLHHTTLLTRHPLSSTTTSVIQPHNQQCQHSLLAAIMGSGSSTQSQYTADMGTLYDMSVKDIDGNTVALSQYRGTPAMVVNVASACGKTDGEYKKLVALYEKYHSQGFEILAFPCNQFLYQESGSCMAIKQFIKKYNVNFPMFDKVNVNGSDTSPIYRFLKQAFPGRVTWNFSGKFFVDGNGVPRARANDNWDEIEQIVQKLIADNKNTAPRQ